MSQWLSHRAHPAQMTRATWLVDQLFTMLPNTAHVILNPGMFADNFLRIIDFPALLGIFPVLMGDSECAPVSNEDMGRVAAALLAAPERYAGMRFRPTGPALMTGREMARVIAGVVGHSVAPVEMPFWLFSKVARMQRVDPFLIASLREYIRDNKAGGLSVRGRRQRRRRGTHGNAGRELRGDSAALCGAAIRAADAPQPPQGDRQLCRDAVLAGV